VRRIGLAGLALLLAGCGSHAAHRVQSAAVERCAAGALHRPGSRASASPVNASAGCGAYRAPGVTLI
jgi:hypothetical protein